MHHSQFQNLQASVLTQRTNMTGIETLRHYKDNPQAVKVN